VRGADHDGARGAQDPPADRRGHRIGGRRVHRRHPGRGSDEVSELARSFAAASRAVRAQLSATEQREAILRDFLANTTHDVMIPLTVLQAHLAAMQRGEQAGAPRGGDVLTSAMDEAHYLGALLQNLAAVAKLDSGVWQPVIGNVDLNALVHRVVSRHQVIARRLEIAVEFAVPDDPVATAGDITLLEQAVSNVVYNAVRHNRAGGHVAMNPRGRRERFSLRVVDDGPGVPADELARLVERGFRGNAARTRSPDGLGLGLNITLRVAELIASTCGSVPRVRRPPGRPRGPRVPMFATR